MLAIGICCDGMSDLFVVSKEVEDRDTQRAAYEIEEMANCVLDRVLIIDIQNDQPTVIKDECVNTKPL